MTIDVYHRMIHRQNQEMMNVSKNNVIIAVIIVIISFFVFRHCARASISVMETVSSSLLYPLLRVQQLVIVPIAEWVHHRATIEELHMHCERLQKLNEKLLAENIALQSVLAYNDETIELHNFNKRYALSNCCVAQVLARHFSPTNQFFLLNAGSSCGIKRDMVALYCNSIIGRVTEVYPWYCKICLVTDSDCKIAATCGKKHASGIHEGMNEVGRTTVRYVSHLESVEMNDTVFSSGEGLVFPKGFALGTIIAADKGELFYTISLAPLLDLQTVRFCTIVAKEDIENSLH